MDPQYAVSDALSRYGLTKLAADDHGLGYRILHGMFHTLPQPKEKPGALNWLARAATGPWWGDALRDHYLGSPWRWHDWWKQSGRDTDKGVGGFAKHVGRHIKEWYLPSNHPTQTPLANAVGHTLHQDLGHVPAGTKLTPEHIQQLQNAGHEHALTTGSKFWHRTGTVLGLMATAPDIYNAFTGPKEQRWGDIAAATTGLAAAPFISSFGIPGGLAYSALTNKARELGHRFDTPTAPPHNLQFAPRFNQRQHARLALRSHLNMVNATAPDLDSLT